MKKHFPLFAIFFCLLIPWNASAQNKSQLDLLQDAYIKKSKDKLYQFFDNWSQDVLPNENEVKNDTVAEAYKVFQAFYNPLKLSQYDVSYQDVNLYKETPYLIVQSSLWEIQMTDIIYITKEEIDSFIADYLRRNHPEYSEDIIQEFLQDESRRQYLEPDYSSSDIKLTILDSALEFRVPLSIEGKKIVYLTSDYKKILNDFLGNEEYPMGQFDIMQPSMAKDDSEEKQKFINNAAQIFYGHWGGYWQYETYPKAGTIIFDRSMQRAIVNFRFVYEGGETFMQKENGVWKIVRSEMTWIE